MELRSVTLLEDATLKNHVLEVELAQVKMREFLARKQAEINAFVAQMAIPADQVLQRNPQTGAFECVAKPPEKPEKKGKK